MKIETFYTNSHEETRELGKRLGSALNSGDVVALIGDLGSGKTTFVQGLAEGLGISNQVKSPSFTIINECKGSLTLYHIDLYRLDDLKELTWIGIEDYLHPDGVTVIEWADKITALLPERHALIKFSYTGENTRRIEMQSFV